MLTVIAGKPKNPKTKKNIVGESLLEYVSKIHVQFIQHLLEVILSGELFFVLKIGFCSERDSF